jgi:hypothetical protein
MSISIARGKVKGWDELQKNRVRKDCETFARLTREGSSIDTVRVSANTAYIMEKCFDKRKGMVSHTDILTLLD